MAPIERSAPASLSQSDVTQAMELSREAGWNQLPDDWLLFLTHGRVFGHFVGPVLAATAAIMPYGRDLSWISMVLTRKNWRGQGLGTSLLKTCIDHIEAHGRTALLDATPAGEPIYRKLGFQGIEGFTRWQGAGGGRTVPQPDATADETQAAIATVNRAFGCERTFLLDDFARRCPVARRSFRDGSAHAFGRNGSLATQIGPVVGTGESGVTKLVADVIGDVSGPVFLDVADRCTGLSAHLQGLGFEKQRPFLRMKKGPHDAPGLSGDVAVIAGPEFG